jgi:hypothetical protein
MGSVTRKSRQFVVFVCLMCLGVMSVSGCAWSPFPGGSMPGQQGPGSAPTLSGLSVSPNPTAPGSIVNLTTSYVDADADLQYGVAAVAVDGEDLSRISFRSTYVSGWLTIPLPVSHYSRQANVQITLRIRDSAGNWSNLVATTLAIR